MVRKLYLGWGHGLDRARTARERFRALLPFRREIQRLTDPFFPLGEDWVALNAVNEALDRAVRHFGLDPVDVWSIHGAVPDPYNPTTDALRRGDGEGR